jgi:hypothetical protein
MVFEQTLAAVFASLLAVERLSRRFGRGLRYIFCHFEEGGW